MTDAGLIVITASISPFRAEREMVRGMTAPGEFVEVFIDTPLAVAEGRDVKCLYAEARLGSAYEIHGYRPPLRGPRNPRNIHRHN